MCWLMADLQDNVTDRLHEFHQPRPAGLAWDENGMLQC
jgi:hypothetical protein